MDAYLVRLDAVGRALTMAQDAYAAALAERDELRGRLEAYAAKAGSRSASTLHPRETSPSWSARADRGPRRTKPADLGRARALVAAYQAYLADVRSQRRRNGTATEAP